MGFGLATWGRTGLPGLREEGLGSGPPGLFFGIAFLWDWNEN